jgi:peptidoglycan-associated lipoprotein
MKRLILFLLIGAMPLLLTSGCGGGPKPEPEAPPVIEPPVQPEIKAEPEPEVKPEPEVVKVKETDFKIVYFDFDKYNLVDSAKSALEHNAQILKSNPSVMVKIEGNCDERGTEEYNLSLGDKRAVSAKNYLVSLGIEGSRLQTISYGKSRPAVQGHNEAAWAKNRRDEFRITSQ